MMVVKASNNRLLNHLIVTRDAKRVDEIWSKDFGIFKIYIKKTVAD